MIFPNRQLICKEKISDQKAAVSFYVETVSSVSQFRLLPDKRSSWANGEWYDKEMIKVTKCKSLHLTPNLKSLTAGTNLSVFQLKCFSL